MMKNRICLILLAGVHLLLLLVSHANEANAVASVHIPDIESNLVVVAVGFRKTKLLVNEQNVPIFPTETNNLGRMDTGVLFNIVSPKQFRNVNFVLGRQNDESGGLTAIRPSYDFFEIGQFYLIPYSIADLGFGEGTNMYFKGGGTLWLNSQTAIQGYSLMSRLHTTGDIARTEVKRYYFSAKEVRKELAILHSKFKEYEKQYKENAAKISTERVRLKKLNIVTNSPHVHDDKDRLGKLNNEREMLGRLYSETKREIMNAEAQLKELESKR